VAALFIV